MAVKLKNVSIEALLAYQKIIEDASIQMSDFFQTAEKNQKEGVVSKSYIDQLEIKLGGKIQKNNEIQDAVEKEIRARMRSAFGRDITLSNYIPVLIDEFKKEAAEQERLIGERKKIGQDIAEKHEEKGGKLKTLVSKEKVVK